MKFGRLQLGEFDPLEYILLLLGKPISAILALYTFLIQCFYAKLSYTNSSSLFLFIQHINKRHHQLSSIYITKKQHKTQY